MKMSSAMATRMKIVALSTLFALASACSGDKKTEGDELQTTGEEAPAVTDEAAVDEAPAEAAPAPTKKKKGNNKKKKGGGKKAPKKKGA